MAKFPEKGFEVFARETAERDHTGPGGTVVTFEEKLYDAKTGGTQIGEGHGVCVLAAAGSDEAHCTIVLRFDAGSGTVAASGDLRRVADTSGNKIFAAGTLTIDRTTGPGNVADKHLAVSIVNPKRYSGEP